VWVIFSACYFASGRNANYCNEYACLCLSVHLHNSKTAWPNFAKFFVHVACGHGSIRLVLRMTIYFHAMGPVGRIKQDFMFRRSSPEGGTSLTSIQLQWVWCLVEWGTAGNVCYLRLTCLMYINVRHSVCCCCLWWPVDKVWAVINCLEESVEMIKTSRCFQCFDTL